MQLSNLTPNNRTACGRAPSSSRSRNGLRTVRAQLTADRPQPVVAEPHTSAEPSASACPFLASLPSPPVVNIPWYKRFQQLFNPQEFQRSTLQGAAGHAMVAAPQQIGFTNFYMPTQPELVKEAFAGETTGITKQANIPSFAALMGEESLVIVQEPQHRYVRGLLQPAFTKEAVAGYLPAIQALVTRHLSKWEAAGDKGVSGYDGLKLLTTEFILNVTLGKEHTLEEILKLTERYQTWTGGFLAWPWWDIPGTPFGSAIRAKESMIAQFQEATTAARARLAAGEEVPGIIGSLVAAVDEEGSRLTDKQICENILLLLLAGHDTSSTTLTRVLSNLQDHPAVMDKLRAEQQAILAAHGEQINSAALKDMEYADAVIRETLRHAPVVAGLFRVAAKDIELGGYGVPEGTPLLLPLHHVAANDQRWAGLTGDLDPAVFNPDRMMTEEGQKNGAQMPFGYGPRYCIGAVLAMAEMKVFLALLARGYSFTADNNTEWVQQVGRVPKNGLPLVIKPLVA